MSKLLIPFIKDGFQQFTKRFAKKCFHDKLNRISFPLPFLLNGTFLVQVVGDPIIVLDSQQKQKTTSDEKIESSGKDGKRKAEDRVWLVPVTDGSLRFWIAVNQSWILNQTIMSHERKPITTITDQQDILMETVFAKIQNHLFIIKKIFLYLIPPSSSSSSSASFKPNQNQYCSHPTNKFDPFSLTIQISKINDFKTFIPILKPSSFTSKSSTILFPHPSPVSPSSSLSWVDSRYTQTILNIWTKIIINPSSSSSSSSLNNNNNRNLQKCHHHNHHPKKISNPIHVLPKKSLLRLSPKRKSFSPIQKKEEEKEEEAVAILTPTPKKVKEKKRQMKTVKQLQRNDLIDENAIIERKQEQQNQQNQQQQQQKEIKTIIEMEEIPESPIHPYEKLLLEKNVAVVVQNETTLEKQKQQQSHIRIQYSPIILSSYSTFSQDSS